MPKELISAQLRRASALTPWGIRIGGGQDRGRVLVLEKVGQGMANLETVAES